MFSEVFAMGGAPAQAGGQPSMMSSMLPLVLMFAVFYFLLIRPQQKKAKKHQEYLNALKKGDEVVTTGGIYGRIVGLADHVLTLEIAKEVRIKVARTHVSGASASAVPKDQGDAAKSEKSGKKIDAPKPDLSAAKPQDGTVAEKNS